MRIVVVFAGILLAWPVLAQNPPANAAHLVAPKISLLVTTGAAPQDFVMPNFVGQPLGSVNRTLQDAGFRLGNVTVAAPAPVAVGEEASAAGLSTVPTPAVAQVAAPAQATPASVVVSQSPAAGQKVVAGTAVSFEVR